MKRQPPPHHYLNRLKKRTKKDWFLYLFLKDWNFERLEPEE